VDRKVLPDPAETDPDGQAYTGPRTRLEEDLANIWQDTLGLEQVGIHDNFFELGGHSLMSDKNNCSDTQKIWQGDSH